LGNWGWGGTSGLECRRVDCEVGVGMMGGWGMGGLVLEYPGEGERCQVGGRLWAVRAAVPAPV